MVNGLGSGSLPGRHAGGHWLQPVVDSSTRLDPWKSQNNNLPTGTMAEGDDHPSGRW